MPQEKPTRGPRFWNMPDTKNGKPISFREALDNPYLESLTGKSNLESYGEQAQLDRDRAGAYYKANPAARKYAMGKAAAASKANGPKRSGQLKTAALQDEMRRGTNKARDQYQIDKDTKQMAPYYQQLDMQSSKLQAEERSAKEREKSPASIQKGMAASTRKTQAASAAAKKAAPAPSMRKLLKIK